MEFIKVYESKSQDCNILRYAAGTNGYKGGDAGHGGKAFIEIENVQGAGAIFFGIEKCGELLKIDISGDSELRTTIEAFSFILKTLEREATKKEKR